MQRLQRSARRGGIQGAVEIVAHLRAPQPPEMIELRHRVALGPVDPQVDQRPGLVFRDQEPGRAHRSGSRLRLSPPATPPSGGWPSSPEARRQVSTISSGRPGSTMRLQSEAQPSASAAPHRPAARSPVWTAVSPRALTRATCLNAKASSVRSKARRTASGRYRADRSFECGRSQPGIGHALHGHRPDAGANEGAASGHRHHGGDEADAELAGFGAPGENRAGHPNLRRGGSETLAQAKRIVDRRVDVARGHGVADPVEQVAAIGVADDLLRPRP